MNAFRFPKNPQAEFPKRPAHEVIDVRTSALPAEFLIRNRQTKVQKERDLANQELFKKTMENASKKVRGELNEGKAITLDDIGYDMMNIDTELGELKGEKKKKKQNKNVSMDIENENLNENTETRTIRRKQNKKKKSKSYYIVNY